MRKEKRGKYERQKDKERHGRGTQRLYSQAVGAVEQ